MFTTLDQKLQRIRAWYGITGKDIDDALERAGRMIAMYNLTTEDSHPNLDIVVCVHEPTLEDEIDTIAHRIDQTYTPLDLEDVWKIDDLNEGDEVRYTFPCALPQPKLTIEVVDLVTGTNRLSQWIDWKHVRCSSGLAILWSMIQSPEWFLNIGKTNPELIIPGLEIARALNQDGSERQCSSLHITRHKGALQVREVTVNQHFSNTSVPHVWTRPSS